MMKGDTSVDPSAVSAFAVYKNMIPGVSSYEDTNDSSMRSRKKKSRRRKLANAEAVVVKEEPERLEVPSISLPGNSSSPKKKKKKNKKRKLVEPDEIEVLEAIESQLPAKVTKSEKKKLAEAEAREKEATVVPQPQAKKLKTLSPIPSPVSKKNKKASPEEAEKVIHKIITNGIQHKQKRVPPSSTAKETGLARICRNCGILNEKEVCVRCKKPIGKIVKDPTASPLSKKTKSGKQNGRDEILDASSDEEPVEPRMSQRNLDSLLTAEPIHDSVVHGKELFEWLIHPTPTEKFFNEHWEKKPLHVKRLTKRDYYSWLMSSTTLDEVMRQNFIKFGKNIDITSYVDGIRETHNPEGRALPAVVWDYYSNGNSVRFLNPQTYIKPLWRLNASLQEYLGTFVGANVYLTPPDSQGFAPHFDDIEAFVIQIEGHKHWKLYKPRTKDEELPRFSSKNFNEERDNLGQPILDVILGPGDLLYFPRGTIHQAKAVEGEHSLHITISAYQNNTYGDLLKIYLPLALEQSISESVELRRGLPTDILSFMGVVHSDRNEKKILEKRDVFQKKIKKLTEGILQKSCDLAADQLGKKLVWDSLPPYLTSKEKRRSVYKDGEFIHEGTVLNRVEIGPDVEVKLIRKNACRLVMEEGSLRLYFNSENSMEYHGEEAAYVEMPDYAGPGIEYLFKKYPEFTKVEDLPMKDEDMRVQLAADLWEKGLLFTRSPLSTYPFDETIMSEDEELHNSSDTSSTDEEQSVEEEEDEEDREFIDDEEEEMENSDSEDEEGGFLDDEAIEDDSEDEAPRLVKRKRNNFIL